MINKGVAIAAPILYTFPSTLIRLMTRQFHNMSVEDREMFAYNAAYNRRQEALKKHFDWIENPIRYCFEFMGVDEQTDAKCLLGVYTKLEKCDDVELHY